MSVPALGTVQHVLQRSAWLLELLLLLRGLLPLQLQLQLTAAVLLLLRIHTGWRAAPPCQLLSWLLLPAPPTSQYIECNARNEV